MFLKSLSRLLFTKLSFVSSRLSIIRRVVCVFFFLVQSLDPVSFLPWRNPSAGRSIYLPDAFRLLHNVIVPRASEIHPDYLQASPAAIIGNSKRARPTYYNVVCAIASETTQKKTNKTTSLRTHKHITGLTERRFSYAEELILFQ